MTRHAAPKFPELSRVFSGYLHEDFAVEYGGPDAALLAFRHDASPAEWRRFQREARQLLRRAEAGDFADVCALIHRLGSRWIPPSRDALLALLTRAADL
jgi:CdiI immunity protein